MKRFNSEMQWDYRLKRYIDVMVKSELGKYVLHSDAQAEIDALKAQNSELLAALEVARPYVLGYTGRRIGLAIAKARGESCNTF